MKTSSLSLRLILLAMVSIAVALATLAFVFNSLFYAYFNERVYGELDQHLSQLTANLSITDDGVLVVAPLPDPRFSLPFSGIYWQAQEVDGLDIYSRSLWTSTIEVPLADQPGQRIRASIITEHGVPLLTLGWTILLGDDRAVALSVAIDETEVQEAAAGFRTTITRWLALIFVGLIVASWVQVRLGLAPLEALRKKVGQIRTGEIHRLDGSFPAEVQPLANEVNELLDLHNASLSSARERASDLAHGLKTPLAVMLTLAQDFRKQGQIDNAVEIEAQVASMRYYIERELARVRTQHPAGIRTNTGPVVDRMVAVIRKFPREEPLEWVVQVEDGMGSPFDAHDLSELLGNLLDNALKWAGSRVQVTGFIDDTGIHTLIIEDDGPGIPDDKLPLVLNRGERLDPATQGSGLGLAICADMIEAYGATFTLGKSDLGGLRVTITWTFA